MFIVLLKFGAGRERAAGVMEDHNAWLKRGFDDGVFLLSGGLKPGLGGAILAHGPSQQELAARVEQDPFVVEGVVGAEILEVAASASDERLAFLLA